MDVAIKAAVTTAENALIKSSMSVSSDNTPALLEQDTQRARGDRPCVAAGLRAVRGVADVVAWLRRDGGLALTDCRPVHLRAPVPATLLFDHAGIKPAVAHRTHPIVKHGFGRG